MSVDACAMSVDVGGCDVSGCAGLLTCSLLFGEISCTWFLSVAVGCSQLYIVAVNCSWME